MQTKTARFSHLMALPFGGPCYPPLSVDRLFEKPKEKAAEKRRTPKKATHAPYRTAQPMATITSAVARGSSTERFMRVDFYGLAFETPCVTVSLWSPWRAAALEHRLFEAVQSIPGLATTREADECRIEITQPKAWRAALQAIARVLKGWQEEADQGVERRSWRWLIEADIDANGYDHNGEKSSLWAILRLSVDRGGPTEPDKGEDIDMEGFGLRIWPASGVA
jgi:hypothetical protein